MLNHPTHDKLNQLKLFGMARALTEQASLILTISVSKSVSAC